MLSCSVDPEISPPRDLFVEILVIDMQIKISYLTFDQLKNQDDITFLKFSVFVIGSLF